MKILEVKGNTYVIDTGMSYIPFYKINKEEIIMLDTGWAKGEREGLQDVLDKNHLKVSGIICTHAHPDHVGNNAYFKQKYGAVTAMPAFEAYICSSPMNLKLHFNAQTLSEVMEHSGSMICETDIYIQPEQNEVAICGINFKIIHTPGHSPAHICIITPDDAAYLGDALISYDVMESSKLPYAYVLKEDLKSKGTLYKLKCSKYIVAHLGIFDDITKLVEDNIIFYKYRAEVIYNVIEGEMTFEEIFKAVIRKCRIFVNNKYRYTVVERMLKSYIQYLNESGAIEPDMVDGFLKYKRQGSI